MSLVTSTFWVFQWVSVPCTQGAGKDQMWVRNGSLVTRLSSGSFWVLRSLAYVLPFWLLVHAVVVTGLCCSGLVFSRCVLETWHPYKFIEDGLKSKERRNKKYYLEAIFLAGDAIPSPANDGITLSLGFCHVLLLCFDHTYVNLANSPEISVEAVTTLQCFLDWFKASQQSRQNCIF